MHHVALSKKEIQLIEHWYAYRITKGHLEDEERALFSKLNAVLHNDLQSALHSSEVRLLRLFVNTTHIHTITEHIAADIWNCQLRQASIQCRRFAELGLLLETSSYVYEITEQINLAL